MSSCEFLIVFRDSYSVDYLGIVNLKNSAVLGYLFWNKVYKNILFTLFLDINECLTNNGACPVNARCINVIGGTRICNCNAGYTGDGLTCTGEKVMVFQISSILSQYIPSSVKSWKNSSLRGRVGTMWWSKNVLNLSVIQDPWKVSCDLLRRHQRMFN